MNEIEVLLQEIFTKFELATPPTEFSEHPLQIIT